MAQATETPLSSTQRETYKGIEGARRFIRDWTAVFDEWEVDLEEVHEPRSSFDASRIAALTIMSSTPMAIDWSRLASNSE